MTLRRAQRPAAIRGGLPQTLLRTPARQSAPASLTAYRAEPGVPGDLYGPHDELLDEKAHENALLASRTHLTGRLCLASTSPCRGCAVVDTCCTSAGADADGPAARYADLSRERSGSWNVGLICTWRSDVRA